jgi:hypothetical protein
VTSLRYTRHAILIALLTLGCGVLVVAQGQVSSADVQRLQDNLDEVSRDLTQLRSRDASLASRLEGELADIRDEIVYLRVKLRRNEPVARSEYSSIRDRIDDIRFRARGTAGDRPATERPAPTTGSASRSSDYDIPPGTEIDVRLEQTLSSKTAQPEDRFEATTVVDLSRDRRVLVPAGSKVRGIVVSVNRPGRIDRKGKLELEFDQITVRNRAYPMRGTLTKAIESEGIKGEADRIGAGAGIGAIIGGILGGFKGVLAGILIGGGGVIAATDGEDVELPANTVLRIRLDSGLNIGN